MCSMGSSSDDELVISQPAKKAKVAAAPRPAGKLAKKMKPASPAKPKKTGARKLLDSDDGESDVDYEMAAAAVGRSTGGRAAAKTYVEISSDEA